jgi:hypothetical protein
VRPPNHRSYLAIIAALAALAVVAGCSGAAQAPVNPTASSSSSVRHVGPLTTVTTVVGIKNDWVMTIIGSGSAMCWSIAALAFRLLKRRTATTAAVSAAAGVICRSDVRGINEPSRNTIRSRRA